MFNESGKMPECLTFQEGESILETKVHNFHKF